MEDYKEIYERIGQYVSKISAGAEYADDITQDVFIKVHQNLETNKNRDRLNSWLNRIAYTTLIDYYRKQKRDRTLTISSPDTLPSETPDAGTGNEILMDCIKILIGILPPEQRELLEAVEIHGMSQVQYAKTHGLPLSTVKSRYQRAKQKIRDQVNKGCIMSSDKYGNVVDYLLPNGGEEEIKRLNKITPKNPDL